MMAKRNRRLPHKTITWEQACDALEGALRGTWRQDFITEVLKTRDYPAALKRMRAAMQSHTFRTARGALQLSAVVGALDSRARQEGFNVLKEWDQGANRFSREDVPVLMVDYFTNGSTPAHQRPHALAVLLDFYFLYLLALLVLRSWDEGDPNQNLDQVSRSIRELQGPGGSGQRFVEDAATLLFVATSNYQPDDQAYPGLLEKVWTLDEAHRIQLAMIGGPVLGAHLRWALTAIYERDLVRMRDDNAVDYPWLFFSVATLMRGYARLGEEGPGGLSRSRISDALLNALSADPWAFVTRPPASLEPFADAQAELRELIARHRDELIRDFDAHVPTEGIYSPISLQFNFPHNALVSIVVLALLATVPLPNLPLNALLSRPIAGSWKDEAAETLARGVTGYAAAHPERRGDRRVLIVAYNQPLGLRSFTRAMSALRKETAQGALGADAEGTDQSAAIPSS
jgi:hypothetical protein